MSSNIDCPKCQKAKTPNHGLVELTGKFTIRGTITCDIDGHERPFAMTTGCIQQLDFALPDSQSEQLGPLVAKDVKEDMQEAERANYAHCYKACVTMCRRALQLALIDCGIQDQPLGAMLKQAMKQGPLLDQKTFDLATSIKGYGDLGAHRRDTLDPSEVGMVVYATVKMVNEVYTRRAALSGSAANKPV